MDNKKYIFLILTSIITIVIITFSVTYAYLSVSSVQVNPNTINSACFSTTFNDNNGSSRINLTKAYPVSNTAGLKLTPYNFSIKNNCANKSNYQIILNVKNNTNNDLLQQLNFSLDGVTVKELAKQTVITLPTGATSSNVYKSYLLLEDSLSSLNETKSYNLRIWIKESASNDIMGKGFEAELMIYNNL